MTLLQISAIIGLLLSFGVPQAKTEEIRGILEHRQIVSVTPVVGSIIVPMSEDKKSSCDPTLKGEVKIVAGDITTGFDLMFYGTSTIPVGCEVDQDTPVVIKLPNNTYTGAVKDWKRNGHIKMNDTGFSIYQGFGFGSGTTPNGKVEWSVGSTTLSVPITE